MQLLYGVYPYLRLEAATTLATAPHDVEDETKSGDLQLGALYDFNQETLMLPALGTKITFNTPTGVDSSGLDVDLKGLATKSLGRLGLHLNTGYEFLGGTGIGERDGRYEVIGGASLPIGAPLYTRTTFLGDLFVAGAGARRPGNLRGRDQPRRRAGTWSSHCRMRSRWNAETRQ